MPLIGSFSREWAVARERHMRTLIYKRTHEGDPDPRTGVFGNHKCMGTVRGWVYDAVIGVGGAGREAERNGIARKLTWVGIGPHKSGDARRPKVTFDHFLYYGEKGPLLKEVAPALARRMYDMNVRVLMDSLSPTERLKVEKILDRARAARPSGQLKGVPQQNLQETGGKCRSTSCRATSAGVKAEQENPADAKERRG